MSQPPGFPGAPQHGPGSPQQEPGSPQGPDDPALGPGSAQSSPAAPDQPGPGGDPPERNKPATAQKVGLILGAAVLALAVLIGGGALFAKYQDERADLAAGQAEADHRAELTRQESAVQVAAQDFLTALTEADADKALSFAAAPPEGNNELLSRDVLLEANRRAAITVVSVEEPTLTESAPGTWTEGTVKVRYSLGDQPQVVDLPVRKVGTEWKIDGVAAPVELGLTGPERLVNGVTVAPDDYNLFPGSYSVTSANPLVSLTTTEFVLAAPSDTVTDWSSDATLSEEGTNQSLEASKHAVEQCLQRRELAPPECPFILWSEDDGVVIDKSTLRYTLKNDPWADAQFSFDADSMTATARVPVEHEIQAEATHNGTSGALIPQTQSRPTNIHVNLREGTPQVTFS